MEDNIANNWFRFECKGRKQLEHVLMKRVTCCISNYRETELPSLLFFVFLILATLLLIGGIEMNPGPVHSNTNNIQGGKALTSSQIAHRKVSALRAMFEHSDMSKHEGSSTVDSQKIRNLAAELDNKNKEIKTIMTNVNENNMEHKLDSLKREIASLRQQSQDQIHHLTEEITRLEKQTQVQQGQILQLMDDNAQVRQQLSHEVLSQMRSISDSIDAGKYESDSESSIASTEHAQISSYRVSVLREMFEHGSISNGTVDSTFDMSEMGESEQLRYLAAQYDERNKMSAYINRYMDNINKSDPTNKNSERVTAKELNFSSVADIRTLFETGRVYEQESKSSINLEKELQNIAIEIQKQKSYVEEVDDTSQETLSIYDTVDGDSDVVPSNLVSDLKMKFETGENQHLRNSTAEQDKEKLNMLIRSTSFLVRNLNLTSHSEDDQEYSDLLDSCDIE